MYTIKNYTEVVVRSELTRQLASGENRPRICDCPLCKTDTWCLAMASLPPAYCMESSYGLMQKRFPDVHVHGVVSKSIARVATRPKHALQRPVSRNDTIGVINLPLEEGSALVTTSLFTTGSPCLCLQCQNDTLAYALNRFPPVYGVSWNGQDRFPPYRREFARHDLALLLGQAAKVVAAHPHH